MNSGIDELCLLMDIPHSNDRGPEIQIVGAWGNWVNVDIFVDPGRRQCGSRRVGLRIAVGGALRHSFFPDKTAEAASQW